MDAYRELVDSHRVDAFVISDVEFHDPRVVFLKERRFPFVAFGRTDPELDVPFVDVDGALGIRLVVRHLVERGHRRIGVLTWPEGSRVGEDRMEGYFTGLHDAGISPQRDWIMRGDGIFNFGYESAMRWLDMPSANRPTAIIAFNDTMAIGVKQAVEERGFRVGIDLAICGFDDTPLVKYLTPPLSSVKQPIWEIGQRIVSMIVDLLEEKPLLYRRMILQPELIIRQSSANHFESGNK